jgi:hypothetical protein
MINIRKSRNNKEINININLIQKSDIINIYNFNNNRVY